MESDYYYLKCATLSYQSTNQLNLNACSIIFRCFLSTKCAMKEQEKFSHARLLGMFAPLSLVYRHGLLCPPACLLGMFAPPARLCNFKKSPFMLVYQAHFLPARLAIFAKNPPCSFIMPCSFIRQVRVIRQEFDFMKSLPRNSYQQDHFL